MAGNFAQVAYDPNAFLKGAQAAQAFNQVRAQNMAASNFNPTDTTQSQADLNGAGLYDQANALADRPGEVQKAALGLQQQQQTLDNGAADQKNQNDVAEWTKVKHVTDMLQNVQREGGDPVAAFGSMKDYLSSELGLDPAHFDAIQQQLASNPDFLKSISDNANKVIGGSLVDTNTGAVKFDGRNTTAKNAQIVYGFDDAGNKVAYQVTTDDNGNRSLSPIPVNGAAPGVPGAAPAAAGGLTEDTFAAKLQTLVPGATITSGLRDAATNARVGGVANSNHLTGQAADVVPPSGMTMADLNKAMQAQGYHTVPEKGNKPVANVNDADHIHVDFNGQHGSAPTSVAAAAPKSQFSLGHAVKLDAGGDLASNLAPEDMDYMARQYAEGKGLPALGSGTKAAQARLDIIHTARVNYGDQLDAGHAAADYKANQSSLVKLTQAKDATKGYEDATTAAIDLLAKAAPAGVGATGIPLIDQYNQSARRAKGDPALAAYDTAINTVAEEYAKVMTGANGNAAATEGARQTAHDRLNAAQNIGEVTKIVNQMKREMAARVDALNSNAQEVSDRMSSPSTKSAAPAAAAGGVDLDALWKKHGGK